MLFRTSVAALAAVLLSTGGALAQIDLTLGHVGEPDSLYQTTAVEFAKRANERLAGKAKIEVYPSSQLGNDRDMFQKLKLNQLQLWIPSTIMSSISPQFGVFEMPYIIKSREHMKRVVENLNETSFNPAAKAKGLLILGTWENGFRHITNNTRPIVKPEDLKGIKLRVPAGEWRVKMFQAYGANPTPMAYSEVFTALKTGVMDGQENPLPQIWGGKFYEVQKYMSMSGHVFAPAWLMASSNHFTKLPEDVQKIISDTAREMEDFVREEAARLEGELVDKMVGMSDMEPNEVDKDAFIAQSSAIYEEFGKSVDGGAELIQKIQALAQ